LLDLLRLIARSHNHASLRKNVMQTIQKDEAIGELFQVSICERPCNVVDLVRVVVVPKCACDPPAVHEGFIIDLLPPSAQRHSSSIATSFGRRCPVERL
jgi:hypothetical protein